MTPIGAVVVGGDYRGLGIVRSLGRRGIPVWVVHGSDAIACYSRYCRRAVPWHGDAGDDGSGLVAFLRDLAQREGLTGWVLFPTSDETAWVLSRHRDELADYYRPTFPDADVYSAAADKRHMLATAGSLGLGVPRHWRARSMAELRALDLGQQDFPVVIKPARRERLNALTAAKAWRADNHSELARGFRAALAEVPDDEVLIQEWIPGTGSNQFAFAALCVRGEPRLSVAARRTRQYPHDFGRASCFVETIDHPDVVKDASRLLAELRVDGLVEVEFKQDSSSGVLKLLDVNVRAWGWHSIGATAGVDFSHAAYRLALGEPVDTAVGRPGVRWSRLLIDLPYGLAEVAAGRLRLRALVRSLRPPLEGPLSAADDVRPALMEFPLLARAWYRRRAGAVTGDA